MTYRTGDLGLRLAGGALVHAGRKDFQIKVRGHRVEIGEVESALVAHPAVREAAVTPDDAGESLVAYLTERPGATASGRALRAHLAAYLPGPRRRMRAGLLGATTILIPCGVTLSTEVIAISSGSWLGGAAVMAGFVAGTAPAFALLGLLVRRVATTRLVAIAAAAALVAGALTVVAGLRLGGWLPDPGGPATATAVAHMRADGTQVITIWSTDHGYRPGVAAIEAGRPTEIVFRTRDNNGCTRTLTIEGQDVTLPVTGEQTVRLAPQRTGRLRYVCGMGMYVGFININQSRSPGATAPSPERHPL
jgi:hypothetical protein